LYLDVVIVLPTTTTTTTFIYLSKLGIVAMNAANKHAYGWGRAVGEDPSALYQKYEGPKCTHCGGEPHWIENVDDDYGDDVQLIENDNDD
jgi:hypothetical protein